MRYQTWTPHLLVVLCTMFNGLSYSQASIDYTYSQVPIGGGGYITGMKIHPLNSDVRYYRTDIGGAYRWNAAQGAMEQIIYVGQEVDDYYGVAGIALDKADENKVFLAVGRKCNLAESAILESADGGSSWTVHESPVYFAANGGRECTSGADKDRQGSPIVLNPTNDDELFIGSREHGLWKLIISADSFVHIAIDSIPSNTSQQSIRNVLFHPSNSNILFVSYAGHGIYRGDINTGIFSELNPSLLDLESVSDLSFSMSGDFLFAACKDKGIYRCSIPLAASPIWELVLPYSGTDPSGEAFLTITAHPTIDDVVATAYSDWNSINKIYISESSGNLGSWSNQPGIVQSNIYPHHTDGFGSHISQLVFDPTDSFTLHFASWFTTMQTSNWQTNPIQWTNDQSRGHEEVVITDICAFTQNTANNFVVHLGGDQTGFLVDTVGDYVYPTDALSDLMDDDSQLIKGGSVDICFSMPDHIVASFTHQWDNSTGDLAISQDGGQSFVRSTGYDDNLGKSLVAVSSTNPSRVVIATKAGLKWSMDGGHTFANAISTTTMADSCNITPTIAGIGIGDVTTDALNTSVFSAVRFLEADKELGCVFYFYNWLDGSFHVSTDYGEHFMKVSDGLPSFVNGSLNQWRYKTRLHAVLGHAQHLWINFDPGLYHSVDGGQNWTQLSNVQNARLIAVGKAEIGSSYPTLFLYGKANGNPNFYYYKSTDEGVSWWRISDPSANENWGNPRMLEGDMEVGGRYYIGTSGLGLVYGDAVVVEHVDTLTPIISCHLDSAVYECSGIIVNRYDSYWTHNDANNDSTIFELDENCNVVREVYLQDIINLDFEEMTKDDEGNFYVAEFGSKSGSLSSNGQYDSLYIYKIPNPDYHCESSVVPEVISFTYPNSHSFIGDTEAMFYDDGKIYLIPKIHSANPNNWYAGLAMIFSIPAIPNPGGQYTATFIDSVGISEYPELPIDYFKVASADLSPDKKTMVMMGGRRLWVITDFTRGVFLDGTVKPISFPSQQQREAIAFADNHTVFIIDENNNYNPNRGNLVKVNLCDFVSTIPDCDCPSVKVSEPVFNYQNAVEEYENGFVNNGSSDLELVYDWSETGNQKVGLRYFDLNIPQGAHIIDAYIQFTVDETDNVNPSALNIWTEDTDYAAVFVSDSFNVSQRIKSVQSVSWSPPNWNSVADARPDQRTPDLSMLIQSIVNKTTWQPNNAMVFIMEGSGNRTAESHYHCQNSGPRLMINYCISPTLPCVDNLLLGNSMIYNRTYEAGILIESSGDVLSSRSTTFSAGDHIELSPGFEVELGAEFIGEIGGCP